MNAFVNQSYLNSDTSTRNATNTAKNSDIGIGEYMSLCNDLKPCNLKLDLATSKFAQEVALCCPWQQLLELWRGS